MPMSLASPPTLPAPAAEFSREALGNVRQSRSTSVQRPQFMALAIPGYTIIGAKGRITEKNPGGVDALTMTVPDGTSLADPDLWCCWFMTSADTDRFLQRITGGTTDSRARIKEPKLDQRESTSMITAPTEVA